MASWAPPRASLGPVWLCSLALASQPFSYTASSLSAQDRCTDHLKTHYVPSVVESPAYKSAIQTFFVDKGHLFMAH
jgi:hypothetical protein